MAASQALDPTTRTKLTALSNQLHFFREAEIASDQIVCSLVQTLGSLLDLTPNAKLSNTTRSLLRALREELNERVTL